MRRETDGSFGFVEHEREGRIEISTQILVHAQTYGPELFGIEEAGRCKVLVDPVAHEGPDLF